MTYPLEFLPEVESTQSYLMALLERKDLPWGYTVFAGRQTRGRGRRGRTFWMSPEGGLPFSSWFPYPTLPQALPWLVLIAGVSLCEVLKPWASVYLRWPNDLVSSKGKKLAGILSEAVVRHNELIGAVVGVGINLFFSPGEPPEELRDAAISLVELAREDPPNLSSGAQPGEGLSRLLSDEGKRILIVTWLERMREGMEELADPLRKGALFSRYNELLLPELRRVTVDLVGIRRIGYIISVNPQGRLRFRELETGVEHEVLPHELLPEDLP